MVTQLTLVAVGRLGPTRDEIICGGNFADTWHESASNLPVVLPYDYPLLFAQEDAYQQGVTDRIMGVPSQSLTGEYRDRDKRAAYTAGYCTSRLLTDAQIAAELEEYRDGMEDDLWHSRGSW